MAAWRSACAAASALVAFLFLFFCAPAGAATKTSAMSIEAARVFSHFFVNLLMFPPAGDDSTNGFLRGVNPRRACRGGAHGSWLSFEACFADNVQAEGAIFVTQGNDRKLP